jgi:hypothetical protein
MLDRDVLFKGKRQAEVPTDYLNWLVRERPRLQLPHQLEEARRVLQERARDLGREEGRGRRPAGGRRQQTAHACAGPKPRGRPRRRTRSWPGPSPSGSSRRRARSPTRNTLAAANTVSPSASPSRPPCPRKGVRQSR